MRHLLVTLIALPLLALGTMGASGDGCEPGTTPEPGPATAGQAEDCTGDVVCEGDVEGLLCVEYYGIAGPSGPTFASCEIPCVDNADCPTGQSCGTIADGPGDVCRPDPNAGAEIPCGPNTCGEGEYCCNESCGICAPIGGYCTQQYCGETY
ncbi:MAG: hypothetical protein ACQEXJ_19485 [Myxococcota bacterium]